jgi:hypothetical protein
MTLKLGVERLVKAIEGENRMLEKGLNEFPCKKLDLAI